jgi:hypothetical protein
LEGGSFVRPPYFILWESREILMRQQKQQQPAPPAHSQLLNHTQNSSHMISFSKEKLQNRSSLEHFRDLD